MIGYLLDTDRRRGRRPLAKGRRKVFFELLVALMLICVVILVGVFVSAAPASILFCAFVVSVCYGWCRGKRGGGVRRRQG
jgi:4-hydroxybenzoate polyprenyltransferase